MAANTLSMKHAQPAAQSTPAHSTWTGVYRAGGAAALLMILTGLIDIGISFIPGTGSVPGEMSVVDWFTLYREQPLLALRNMGILNVVNTFCGVLVFYALFGMHRRVSPASSGLALTLSCLGAAVYIASNVALPMLSLSSQYAAATSEAHKTLLVSAGQALLAQEDTGTGSFLSFFLPEIASALMAVVMLRGRVFSRWAGWAGLLGYIFLALFSIISAFIPGQYNLGMGFALVGGPLSLAWMAITALCLLRGEPLEPRAA